ncbi:MAG TPA: hypothetical protein VFZ25_08335, partial [Chloroflexota bacterium]|nr:hypothetical protein [Chloroflexota bacterium]
KIDKLRNTALFLGEQLTHRVHALIVTPVDLVAVPQEAARYGVAFIDRQQIEELWDLIRQANIIQARSRFLQWIQDVPPLGGA